MSACPIFNSLIGRLFFWRRPSHVSRFVVSVYINAIQGMKRSWSWPHIGQEIRKGFLPPLAHGYSTTAVVVVLFSGRRIASSFHVSPCSVFRRWYTSWSGAAVSMNKGTHFSGFPRQASTGSNVRRSEVLGGSHGLSAANARAQPPQPGLPAHKSSCHGKQPEFSPNKINSLWHDLAMRERTC